MYDKTSRHNVIKDLVKSKKIQSQEELQTLLEERGFAVTQATLSRDMKALRIVKMHDAEVGYSYRIPTLSEPSELTYGTSLSMDGVLSIEFSSSSFAVIRTRPGFAGVIGSIVDSGASDVLMGSVAGDDTVMLLLRERFSREQVLADLSEILPGIKGKLI